MVDKVNKIVYKHITSLTNLLRTNNHTNKPYISCSNTEIGFAVKYNSYIAQLKATLIKANH